MKRVGLVVPLVSAAGFLLVGCSDLGLSADPGATSGVPAQSTDPSTDPLAGSSPSASLSPDSGQQTGGANPSPYVTPSAATGAKPSCKTVWQDEERLPAKYAGCTGGTKGDDEYSMTCTSGPALWIRQMADSSEYFAFAGKSITHTKDPDGDAHAMAACQA